MSETTSSLLPNRLREFRKRRKLTLKQVADLTGIKLPNVAKIEKDERDLKSIHLSAFSKAYGIPAADLLLSSQGGLSDEERRIIGTYRELPRSLQATFRAVLDGFQDLRGKTVV